MCSVSEDALALAVWMKSQGFMELGYTRANFDDCIVVGRDPSTHALIPDPKAFPYGVLDVSKRFGDLGYQMGWYTVRGDTTCASGPPPRIERPGSNASKKLDAETYASWGVAYLKDDTCGGPNVPYQVMRDALNSSGTQVFFRCVSQATGPRPPPWAAARERVARGRGRRLAVEADTRQREHECWPVGVLWLR